MPKERTEFVTDYSVKNATRLLCVDKVDVYFCRFGDFLRNLFFGDLVKRDADIVVHVKTEFLRQVPCNGFSLAVRVGCEICFLIFRICRFEFADYSSFSRFSRNDEFGFEIMLDVNGKT